MNIAYDFIIALILAFVLVMMKQYVFALIVVVIYALYKYNKKKPYILATKVMFPLEMVKEKSSRTL